MSEHEEQTKGFKVTDRRSFTPEGDLRVPEDVRDERDEPVTTTASATVERAEGTEQPTSARPATTDERFFDLLSLLTTQASLQLGEPHPVTGASHEDLRGAQVMISLIEVLHAKTKGNLSLDEERALEDVLYQLRTQFMAKAKRSKS
jgi:hypothetical protein